MKLLLRTLFVWAMLLNVRAVERWADTRLAQKDGLELWLDNSRQGVGRKEVGLQPIVPGMLASYLMDASGHARHLAQLQGGARPVFREEAGLQYLRFDGTNDALVASGLHAKFQEITVFIVASPHANLGMFSAFCGMTRAGFNDYTSGLNIDFGPSPSMQLSLLNVEGAGAGGISQLLTDPPLPFGGWHVLSLVNRVGTKGVQLTLDSKKQGARDRQDSEIFMDEFVLGARCYSNQGDPPFVQGFFQGDIAEVLVYGRALNDEERSGVEKYLKEKYATLLSRPPVLNVDSKPLVLVSNLPPVQVFLPGFTVRELPLSLRNINNIKYRIDGKLVALGYDGQILLLSDTDGDGLEDRVQAFWTNNTLRAPIGMALTPAGYAKGQGAFVASKGKVSLIVDTNGDDVADQEMPIADGWKELSHGVDALGVAVDKDGSVFFGLGTANFTDAYLIDKNTGEARYDLRNERGTILKVSPDFKQRQIVCTGIRFPVGLAFYRNGDLFCTDQEGATWLSNGNPLDELLYIQQGRHYGFPPRHPKYLPGVIDEPSVFDYAPQHQSTCGLSFNEPVSGGRSFGPAHWAGDAIVSGYSRGKLWRTKLVKTTTGYVAQTQLIASLSSLTVDACVSPQGDLVVATHGGEPDWGSGPSGSGRLFKIRFADPNLPQPVLASMTAPGEFEIAFDRSLDPATLKDLAKRVDITRGKYVSAGDRFEAKRPGYAVIYHQLSSPRYNLPVESATFTPDARTLVLRTRPVEAAANYAITLSGFERSNDFGKTLPQHPDVDLATDANGLELRWRSANGEQEWQGWVPHIDLEVSRSFTTSSARHEALWKNEKTAGTLSIRGQLDLWQMLQPVIQPGATLDYERPVENVSVLFAASEPFQLRFGGKALTATKTADRYEATVQHRGQTEWLPFELTMPSSNGAPTLTASWFTEDDSRSRPFPLRRFLMPWAKPDVAPASEDLHLAVAPELAGGNWSRGKRLFFGEVATCYKCHSVRGEGHNVGPDLSNLIHRDYASVLKDIRVPNAALNPDHLSYLIQLNDGEEITGVLLSNGREAITVADVSGRKIIPRAELRSMKPTGTSLMPEGLDKALGDEQLKDLLTFLLVPPLQPATIHIPDAPAARTRAEVNAFLNLSGKTNAAPLRVLLCSGPKDHGTDEHDYPLWLERWSRLLALDENVTVSTNAGWPSAEAMRKADVIVFYSNNPGWSAAKASELDAFQKRGGGLVYIHFAVDGHDAVPALAERIGLAWRGGQSKFRHGELDMELPLDHPITRGLSRLSLHDESYWDLAGDPGAIQVLATNVEDGKPRPLLWTYQRGAGRVFVSIPGHYTWTFDDPLFRAVLLRGTCWAAHQPENRLEHLAAIGARITESPGATAHARKE